MPWLDASQHSEQSDIGILMPLTINQTWWLPNTGEKFCTSQFLISRRLGCYQFLSEPGMAWLNAIHQAVEEKYTSLIQLEIYV